MAEYIDREALLEKLQERDLCLCVTKHDIEAAPAADVAPVVHKEWELNDDGSATCKHCGRTTKYAWDYDSVFKYCPDCGSRNG